MSRWRLVLAWYPKSFFARTLLMVLFAVLFSKALTLLYLLWNDDVLVDRQYSLGAALTLRAYWAAPPGEREAIAEAAGLQRVREKNLPVGEQQWPYGSIFIEQMRSELGAATQVRISALTPPSLYVFAPKLGPDWIRVPLYPHPLRGQRLWNLFGWFLGIGLLTTAAAWMFVRQLSMPLKRLLVATRQFGRGGSVHLPVDVDTASEIAEVYRAFNQMTADIEQANRERELMLAGISHDLRTPLTRMRLSLEFMGDETGLAKDMVHDIEDMDAILEQFLAFVRDGRDEPLTRGDLAELIQGVLPPYLQQGLRVDFQAGSVPHLPLRRLSIKRMLVNLLENALRYGGQQVAIRLSTLKREGQEQVLLVVRDSGPGIAEGELSRVFSPFIRGDQSRSSQGTGLGLAIVKRIVSLHQGQISLANHVDGGLEVSILLPLENRPRKPKLIRIRKPGSWILHGKSTH